MDTINVGSVTSDEMLDMAGILQQIQKNFKKYRITAVLKGKSGNIVDYCDTMEVWSENVDMAKIAYASKNPKCTENSTIGAWSFICETAICSSM